MTKKVIGIPFKKGVSGNPLGGKLHNPELRAIKRLTSAEVAEIGTLIVSKNAKKLKDIITDAMGDKSKGISANPDSKHSSLKVWIATVALKGITKGDAHALDVLLNRITGRVKEKIELTGEEGGPIRQIVGAMTPDERKLELKRLRRIRAEAGED